MSGWTQTDTRTESAGVLPGRVCCADWGDPPDVAWPRARVDGEVNHRRWGLGWPSLSGLSPTRECPMTTTTSPAALVPVAPVFTNTERLALAGFLAGYSGLTRQAYELD